MLLSRAISLFLGTGSVSKRQDGPQALVIPPTGQFLGNDGQFSTFLINVGTPPQPFRILPAPNRFEFALPLPASCDDLKFQNCAPLRGVVQSNSTGFNTSASSTWQQAGAFKYENNKAKTYEDEAMWGFDTVAFANTQPEVPAARQLIAGFYNSKSRFVGLVGLDPSGTKLGNDVPRGLGPLQVLRDNNTIPSRTFGYTAGAKYDNINGSLILGGFDASLLSVAKVVIPINRSLGTYPLGVLSITAENVLNDHSGNLSTSKITLPIDATVTELWLPREICDEFEKAFNLTWNDTVSRYLVDNETHRTLKDRNPKVTFTIAGADTGGGETNTTTIKFPYGAFDLFIDMNIATSPVNYFPIRRAADASQFTLGRVFLQEAYLLADFDQEQFTIAQTTRSSPPTPPNIVTVSASNEGNPEENGGGENGGNSGNGEGNNGSGSSGLSGGAIAGIVIGVLALIAIILGIFFWRRKKNSKEPRKGAVELPVEEKPASWRSSLPAFQKNRASRNSGPSTQTAQPAHEVEGSRVTSPAPLTGNEEYFAPKDRSAAAELEGSPGPRYELH